MGEKIVENNNFELNMTSNGFQFDDNCRETYRPIDSNDGQTIANLFCKSLQTSDSVSKCSSKSSIKSNGSEDKHSVKSHKSNSSSKIKRFLMTKDRYCWDCHKSGVDFSCIVSNCLRSYHKKCPSLKKASTEGQSCPECIGIMRAEEGTNPSGCMQLLNGNIDKMAELLSYTIITVKHADRNQSFHCPVSTEDYPDYLNIIVNPMDLNLIEDNIKNKTYASTNSFLADIKWIYHNCLVFNSDGNNALISDARNILRVAKQECEEIEICPDCYLNYYTLDEDNYFRAVCERPHAIVWAKLKGHPYWPAKIVRYNHIKNEVDVRFFGTHDKCWLKPEKCLLMSKDYPNNKKRSKYDQNRFKDAIDDLDHHLNQLEEKFKGFFKHYDNHTVFTADHLYLTNDNRKQTEDNHTIEPQTIPQTIPQTESEKKVVNWHNGIQLKELKVNASKFDISSHMIERNEELPLKSPPLKRFKRTSLKISSKPKPNRCFSSAISVREELSSSIESDQSLNDTKDEPSKNDSNYSNDLLKRIKILEFKKRKLEEELIKANNKTTALEEEIDELKKANEEMVGSISDIKKKQWCVNCSKEGILPCCWNTCYCTVDCQHEHWPIHSKSCRRRQQTSRT